VIADKRLALLVSPTVSPGEPRKVANSASGAFDALASTPPSRPATELAERNTGPLYLAENTSQMGYAGWALLAAAIRPAVRDR